MSRFMKNLYNVKSFRNKTLRIMECVQLVFHDELYALLDSVFFRYWALNLRKPHTSAHEIQTQGKIISNVQLENV